jgi:hypothetical protein
MLGEANSRKSLTVLQNDFRDPVFQQMLLTRECGSLVRDEATTLQINVGKF